MTVRIITGHVLDVLAGMAPESVHMVLTSPPYLGLRAYGTEPQTWPDGWVGELGQESDVASYIAHLVAVFAAVKRVLRGDGMLFCNLGDSYATSNPGGKQGQSGDRASRTFTATGSGGRISPGIPAKNLMLVPQRFAIAMQQDGWIVRSVMPWVKRNCLSGGTRVYVRSQKGDMPMTVKDLARLDPATVQLWNGEKWTHLVGIWESERPDDLLEIRLRSGERVGCTADHRWPTQRGVVAASDLLIGDVVQTTTLPGEISPHEPIGLDAERVGWFVGLYIAEGHRTKESIVISGHIREGGRFERLCELAAAYDGTCRVHHTGGNVQRVVLSGPVLRGILDSYVSGEGSQRKHLTTRAWQRSDVFLRAVLDGYLSGDGHWDERNRRWRLGFCQNDDLAADLRTICGRLGLSLRLNRCQHQLNGRKIPGWRGQIRFDREDRTPRWGGFRLAEDGEIVEIGKSRARKVWDLTVADEPHLFALASGVLTHNCMPESVTDRPTSAVEDVILFTRSPRYFWDAEAVRREAVIGYRTNPNAIPRTGRNAASSAIWRSAGTVTEGVERGHDQTGATYDQSSGRSYRNSDMFFDSLGLILDEAGDPLALDVNPEPFRGAHFATFPPKLVRPLILAGTSEKGCCAECGAPWVRQVEKEGITPRQRGYVVGFNGYAAANPDNPQGLHHAGHRGDHMRTSKTTGWSPSCRCGTTDTRPCLVLDCFAGAGTTGLVADQLGRDAVLIDLQPTYVAMGASRITGDAPLFASVEVTR